MRYILVIGVIITGLGTVFFFPLNINEKYTCLFHRIFDHTHPVSDNVDLMNGHVHTMDSDLNENRNSALKDAKDRDGIEKELVNMSHGSYLLDNYLKQYAVVWWTSVGLFALSVLSWLKQSKNSNNIKSGMLTQ